MYANGGFCFYTNCNIGNSGRKEDVFTMKRQGDLLIVKVDKIPQDALPKNNRVLAEGEATGHMHELDSGEVYEKEGTMYFHVPAGKTTNLNHPEHKTMTFTPGEYKVVRQREYVPGDWRGRIVRD